MNVDAVDQVQPEINPEKEAMPDLMNQFTEAASEFLKNMVDKELQV